MTDRSPADVARDSVPGFRAAEAAVATISAQLDANRRASLDPAPDLAAELVDALVAGEQIPADLGQRHIAAQNRGATLAAETEVLNRAAAQAASRRDERLRQGVDRYAIPALRPLLAQVVDTARQVADDLADVHSADDAIRAGRAQQWQQLDAAARQYREIRAAQRGLYAAAGGEAIVNGQAVDHRSLMGMVGDISNVGEVWPDWLAWHRDAEGGVPWPEGDDRAYLVWLATHPAAEPWVPTTAELGDAFGRQQRAAQTRERAAEEEAAHGRRLSPEERQANADRAATRNTRQAQRAARIAAAANY